MTREFAAVLMTYATRRSFQWIVGLGGVLYLLIVALMLIDPRPSPMHRAQSAVFILGFPAGFLAFLLVSQAKWQFVDPRARMLPRFAAPHLATLLIIALVGLLALPFAAALAARLNVLGFLACSIAIAACLIWATHNNKFLWILLGLVTFYSLISGVGVAFWLLPEEASRFRPYHLAIFGGGWAAFAAWLIRLSRLDEEADDYQIPIQAQSGSATRMERTQANRAVGRQMSRSTFWRWPADAWHDRLMGRHESTVSGRQGLFRYGFMPVPVEINGLWAGLVMLAVGTFPLWGFVPERNYSVEKGALSPFFFMPAMFAGQFLAMRRARLSHELLLPLTRTEFVDGILRAMVRVVVITSGLLAAVFAALIVIDGDELPPAAEIVAYAAIAVGIQPFMFGGSLRAALYSSAMVRLGLMMAAMLPGIIVGTLGVAMVRHGQWGLVVVLTIVSTAFGVWITARARRAWLNAEFA